jgi:N-acylneuraminate cytidylyltransferase/CMP-N,N'-diacetyllegionaminic acid synthase
VLQPTTLFHRSDDIDGAFDVFTDDIDTDAVASVCFSDVQPDWFRQTDDEGWFEAACRFDVPQHSARQAMFSVYKLNGGLYWVRTNIFLSQWTLLPTRTRPYIMPCERSVDIDSELDLRYANWLSGELAHVDNTLLIAEIGVYILRTCRHGWRRDSWDYAYS